MTNPVPLGLVGCGGMGQRHVLGYEALRATGHAAVEIVAVCDTNEENARRAAAEVARVDGRTPSVHLSVESALADPAIAAFDVVTDASSHVGVVVPLLEAGRHVMSEKPLGLTVRSCRRMIELAAKAGVVLATAENYRRDPVNRLAKAVVDSGLLGELHLMTQTAVGGDDRIVITPWRHLKERGAIGLDMGVHLTDIVRYYLGEIESVFGRGLIAEPVRRRQPGPELELESYRARFAEIPEQVVATGEDSVIAMYRMRSGVSVTVAYVPSGPGHSYWQRTVHGRAGSMAVPVDRSGGPVEVRRAAGILRGRELLGELDGFELDRTTAELFGPGGVTYDLASAQVDAALLAIELQDFGEAIQAGRPPEVDGTGGLNAVAAVLAAYESDRLGRSVTMSEVLDGSVSGYQDEIDAALGLR